jgi:hypothetical protein
MAFCVKCGSSINDGVKFCQKCGASVSFDPAIQGQNQNVTAPVQPTIQQNPSAVDKNNGIIFALVAIVLIAFSEICWLQPINDMVGESNMFSMLILIIYFIAHILGIVSLVKFKNFMGNTFFYTAVIAMGIVSIISLYHVYELLYQPLQ